VPFITIGLIDKMSSSTADKVKRILMPKRQRVFKGGTEYIVTGPTKRERRLVFLNTVKLEGREILLFKAVKKIAKQLPS
jgi:hypothetical protein